MKELNMISIAFSEKKSIKNDKKIKTDNNKVQNRKTIDLINK